jgi:hypothetical protein
VAIAADGTYSVDTDGMTGPFVLRAEATVGGRSYRIHSAATAADVGGKINITPLTEVIIANIAGQIAENYFNSGNFSGVNQAALASPVAALREKLAGTCRPATPVRPDRPPCRRSPRNSTLSRSCSPHRCRAQANLPCWL